MKEKHICRYYGPLFHLQERWLNRMAQRGWRLSQAGKLRYTFTPCQPGTYEYRVEFAGHLSHAKSQEYQKFLEEMGYRVLTKNLNLNWSLGKIRWRPYGEGWGQIVTSPGSYNKEVFLVERNADGLSFPLHTTHADQARYCRTLRNLCFTPALLCWAMALWLICRSGLSLGVVILALLGLPFFIPALVWAGRERTHKSAAELTDG